MGSNLPSAQTLSLGYEAFLASKWPQIILEVTPDLKFELCGLNNPCSSAFLAAKCMKKPFIPFYSQEGQNGLVDLRAIAAGKNHIIIKSDLA